MMIPIRCTTCGKPIAHLWEEFKTRISKGEDPKTVLDSLGLKSYCCRTVFLTQPELIDLIGKFNR